MAEENVSQVKEMITEENHCFDDGKPMEIIEETSVETNGDNVHLPPAALSNGNVNLRRYSTGGLDKKGPGKAQIQTRYRGNQTSSTHDVCKHGKRREDDLLIKPWKLVKKKDVESGGDLGTGETLRRKSLGNVSKPEKTLQVDKREVDASEIIKPCDDSRVKRSETKSINTTTTTPLSDSSVVRKIKKTNLDVKKVSRISENKSCKEDLMKNNEKKKKIGELAKYEDVSEKSVSRTSENKSSKDQNPMKNQTSNEKKKKIGEPAKCEDVLEKSVSRTSENKSSKDQDLSKNLTKNKEKTKIDEPVGCDDVLEKTLYVVESSGIEEKKKSIKSVKSEIQQSSEKKILRGSGKKSPTLLPSLSPSSEKVKEPRITRSDPRPVRQTTSMSKTGQSEKKESGSATLVTNSKTESKIRPKRIGLKVTPPPAGPPTKPLSFKKGKVLEPKKEDSTPTLIKYKKRVVQEPKLKSDGNKKKKNLLVKREAVGKINGEGKREKVVLRHRKVEAKKKLQTLFNNVIEETVNKLEEVRKSKVQALVGAFETVISLQDDNTKTSQRKKIQSKSTSSQVIEG